MVDQKLMDKLEKIKTLADRAGTPDEAAAAAAKLQELLFKHNLTMADVSQNGSSKKSAYGKTLRTYKNFAGWKKVLLYGVAKANFCEMIYTSGTGNAWLVGEQDNVAAVQMMADYLEATIHRMGNDVWKVEARYDPANVGTTWKIWHTSFCVGAADSVVRRLLEEKRNLTRASEASTALVILKDEQLAEAMREFFPNAKPGRRTQVNSGNGYNSGREAGKSIGLQKQIGG